MIRGPKEHITFSSNVKYSNCEDDTSVLTESQMTKNVWNNSIKEKERSVFTFDLL